MNRPYAIARSADLSVSLSLISLSAGMAGLLIAACALPLPPEGDLTTGPGSPPVPREIVSYGFDIQPIFDKNCVVCHSKDGFAEQLGIPLRLNSGQAHMDLINQPSAENPNLILVIPGDPENSFLWQKVALPLPPLGFRMPLLTDPLDPVEIDLIRRWIEQGAQ